MYKLYENFMSEAMQAELIHSVSKGDAHSVEVFIRAKYWFAELVKSVAEVNRVTEPSVVSLTHTDLIVPNSEIHLDSPKTNNSIQYMMTVSNNPFASTLFFDSKQPKEIYRKFSHELLVRDGDSRLIARDTGLEFEWDQAQTGQLASFDQGNQLHAAAPLETGDIKVLLQATIYTPGLNI